MQNIQMLPLVLVNALRLYIKQALGVNQHTGLLLNKSGLLTFLLLFNLPPAGAKFLVIDERLEFSQLFKV